MSANDLCRVFSHGYSANTLPSVRENTRQTLFGKIKKNRHCRSVAAAVPLLLLGCHRTAPMSSPLLSGSRAVAALLRSRRFQAVSGSQACLGAPSPLLCVGPRAGLGAPPLLLHSGTPSRSGGTMSAVPHWARAGLGALPLTGIAHCRGGSKGEMRHI